jgi:hypothetical protein
MFQPFRRQVAQKKVSRSLWTHYVWPRARDVYPEWAALNSPLAAPPGHNETEEVATPEILISTSRLI